MARKRGNKWQADVKIDGVRKRPSFDTQAEAEKYEKQVEEGVTEPSSVKLSEFINQHFNLLWGKTKTPQTSRINCNVLIKFLGADTLLPEIKTAKVIQLINDMETAGKSPATINRKLSTLSKILKLAVRLEVIDKRPELDFQKEGGARDRVMSKDEEVKAFLYLDHLGLDQSAALVRFLLYTGCRYGEARKLVRADVSKGRVTFRDTKNGSTRQVPLVGPALEGWKAICRLTNVEAPFSALPKETFRGHWAKLCGHLEITDEAFVPHCLRHTCATRLVIAGVPLPQVMKWMGHKNIQTTMRYSHLAPKDRDKAAEALLQAA